MKTRLAAAGLISTVALLVFVGVAAAQGVIVGGCGLSCQTTAISTDWVSDPLEIITSTTTPSDCGGYLIQDPLGYGTGWTSFPGACLNGTSDGIAIKSAPSNGIVNGYYVNAIDIYISHVYSAQTITVSTSAGSYSTGGIGVADVSTPTGSTISSTSDTAIIIPINAVISNNIQIFWNFGSGQTCVWTGGTEPGSPDSISVGTFYTTCPSIDSIIMYYSTPTNTPMIPTGTMAPSWTVAPTGTDYPTYTPAPGSTAGPTATTGPTVTPIPTLDLSTRVMAALVTPTDYPCNADNYVFQNGNNNLGTPCGNLILFATIALPTFNLPSPTLYVIRATPTPIPVTATPSITPSPTVTPSITPTSGATTGGGGGSVPPPTSFSIDISSVSNFGTAVSAQFATIVPMANLEVPIDGTQVGVVGMAQNTGNGIGAVIVFARTITTTGFDAGGLITMALLLLVFIVAVQLFVVIIPLAIYIYKLVVQVVGIIVDII